MPKSKHNLNKNPAAVQLGRLGGAAGRGARKARPSESARRAAQIRWNGNGNQQKP